MTATKPYIGNASKRTWPLPAGEVNIVPPLNSGDRLSRAEFERRYTQTPEKFKAELVEGVVYMASPLSVDHARPHSFVIGWLTTYMPATPGTDVADNVTLRLDADNEVQPDALLRIEEGRGGRSTLAKDRFIEGAPELIVEIAATSASYDLHDKLRVYRRNGVLEYLVWQVYDHRFDWFELKDGEYVSLAADPDGVLRSRVFPGLWLAVQPLLAGDLAAVLVELHKGLAAPEHDALVKHLAGEKQTGS